MKKMLIMTASIALALGLSPFAGAQTADNSSVTASDHSRAAVKTKIDNSYNDKTLNANRTITKTDSSDNSLKVNDNDTDTNTITKTYTDESTKTKDSYNDKTVLDGKAKNSGASGAAANNHSTAHTRLDVDVNNAFNKTHIVNSNKLDGYVSHNHVRDIGNHGGAAVAVGSGNGGYGGDGGHAEANGKSGDTKGGYGGDATSGLGEAAVQGGSGAPGSDGGTVQGGGAGTFNASNTLSGLSGAAGVTVTNQNTGIAALQQVGVTTMANVTVH